ncbi:MAG TPA: DUF6499 domain-containing protein, partial [Gammaproteobacteria bacterium]
MSDWRCAADYAYTQSLSAAQWAWEFLRRNPDYQRDYRQFIAVWRALEDAYGAPPDRDFPAWKADPRAYVGADDAAGEGCRVDQDKVLIECALGAKWGFHKFPKDPAIAAPDLDEAPAWRTESVELPLIGRQDTDYLGADAARVALGFDLSLPLGEQIERAKLKLGALKAARRRAGTLIPRSIATLRARWTVYLRLLDAQAAGVDSDAALTVLSTEGQPVAAAELSEPRRLCTEAYRRIAGLPAG